MKMTIEKNTLSTVINIRRKSNIKLLIDTLCDGKVSKFCVVTNKHRTYVYQLLRSPEENNSLPVTSKMARYIEEKFWLITNTLDQEDIHSYLVQLTLNNPNYSRNFPIDVICNRFNLDSELNRGGNCFSDKSLSISLKLDLESNFPRETIFFQVNNDQMSPRIKNKSRVILENLTLDYVTYAAMTGSHINKDGIPKHIFFPLSYNGIFLIYFKEDFKLVRAVIDNSRNVTFKIDNPFLQHEFPPVMFSLDEYSKHVKVIGKVIGILELDLKLK